jgi:hypothetical protein
MKTLPLFISLFCDAFCPFLLSLFIFLPTGELFFANEMKGFK